MAKKKKQNKTEKITDDFAKMIFNDEKKLKELKDVYKIDDKKRYDEIRKAQLDLKNSDAYKDKSFYIPTDALVNVPISGMFKIAIQDTLNFCFSRMTKEETIRALLNIQTNFEGIKDPEKDLFPSDMAIWTIMSLLTEINLQAQEQGKLINTDESVGDIVTEFMEKVESDPEFKITSEEIDKITKDYKPIISDENGFKFVDEEESKDEESKDEKSDTNEG